MKTRFSSLLLIVILGSPVFMLNYSLAIPVAGVPPPGSEIVFSGWPYVAMIGESHMTNSGVMIFENRKFAVIELLIDGVVSVLLIGLVFVALTVFICPRFPQFSLIDIFAFTSAVACVTIYFLADPDIFGPYFRVRFVPSGPSINVRVSDRPFWQNAMSATYMLLAFFALISIFLKTCNRRYSKIATRNNMAMDRSGEST